jgi:hypothetical protein
VALSAREYRRRPNPCGSNSTRVEPEGGLVCRGQILWPPSGAQPTLFSSSLTQSTPQSPTTKKEAFRTYPPEAAPETGVSSQLRSLVKELGGTSTAHTSLFPPFGELFPSGPWRSHHHDGHDERVAHDDALQSVVCSPFTLAPTTAGRRFVPPGLGSRTATNHKPSHNVSDRQQLPRFGWPTLCMSRLSPLPMVPSG